MTLSFKRISALLVFAAFSAALFFFSTPVVRAHDHMAIDATASTSAGMPPKPSPLRILNSQIKEKRAEIREDVQEHKAAIGSTTRGAVMKVFVDRKNASTSELHQERREDMKEKIEARAHEMVKNQLDRIIKRLNAAVDRLENIASRIDTRLEKMKAEDIDTTAALALQVTAKAKIAEAQVKVDAIVKPSLSEGATREEYKAAFEATRAQVKAAEEAVRAAHKALMDVMTEVKKEGGARVKADASVESTDNN